MYYSVDMSTTITVRASEALRRALDQQAAARGKTVSALVREILEEAVAERPLKDRVGHLRGSLGPARGSADSWRQRLRERNWRR